MILETIFMWVGGLLVISAGVLMLYYIWSWLFENRFHTLISVKALFWHIGSEHLEKKMNKSLSDAKMKVGTCQYVRYKKKRYLWQCIKVEDLK